MKQTTFIQIIDIAIIAIVIALFLLKIYDLRLYALIFALALFSTYLKFKNSTSEEAKRTILIKIGGLAMIGASFWFYQTIVPG